MSISLLPRLLPLAFVWTSSKLLVLESLLVNSVKLNLLALVVDSRLSAFGREVPSSEALLDADISILVMAAASWEVLCILCDALGRLLALAVCGRTGGTWLATIAEPTRVLIGVLEVGGLTEL